MDVDLSVPFRRATAKVVHVGGGAATAAISSSSSTTVKYFVIAGIVALLFYFFFVARDDHPVAPRQRNQPQTPAPDALATADSAFARYNGGGSADVMTEQYHRAINNYMEALNAGHDAAMQGHIFHRLATIFHQGVPETDGFAGIPPDAQQAISFYREAIKQGYHGAVMPLASIYHWGLTGYEGNREVAKHLYGVVLKTGSDYEKGVAKDRLRQMREEDGQTIGNGMLEEDAGVAANFSGTSFGADPYAEHFMDFDKSPFSIGKDETTRGMDEKYVDDLIQNKLSIRGRRRDDPSDKKVTRIRRDPQNARDHVVVNSAKQSLERLRASTNVQYDVPTTFKMIHEYIVKKSDVSSRKRDAAAQVLRELSKGIANLGYEQAKEIEALHLVWNRINSAVHAQDAEKRHTLCENLVCELAECIEYGELVCPTGRLNRIIDTLNHLDPVVNIQPKWAVQQTMVARAGALEKDMLAKSNASVREAMAARNPNASQRQLQAEFMQKVKSAIEREFTRRYVDTGMMTKELLQTEIEAWML